MQVSKLPPYEQLATLFNHTEELTPERVHGLLCGLFCTPTAKRMAASTWVSSFFQEYSVAKTPEVQTLLTDLYQISQSQLLDINFEFELMLPPDDYSLTERALGLRLWLNAFIQGLELGGDGNFHELDDDAAEALNTLAQVATLDVDSLEYSEAEENEFIEVVEFVRMAVLIVYLECHALMDDQVSENESLH